MYHNSFRAGLRDGLPIALGYFPVSFTFGMLAISQGLPAFQAVLISATNLTSAGQFAGLTVIAAGASLLEMALTQLVINLRYALMSLSLSQKLDSRVTLLQRCIVAFGNTDEIFAVASSKPGTIGARYLYGLILGPMLGWTGGTLAGAVASGLLPAMVQSALGVAIYGMFIAIVVPPARQFRPVLAVVLIALALSCGFAWLPVLRQVSAGFAIIFCTVLAAGAGALLFPLEEKEEEAAV
ncbi:MAG TPA: AzlC family ABC transporter permease [Candidatus Anaerofilum faecale]|nr:AzlC family ABC transporter permease [Anaerofilum sp. An201]OUP04894.1 branched-chain amino acid ABC transporter permease [Anaerofilum sp. An201]HIX13363.1 AzlC family ABC transporter permease [Candidatus Anaerofilum faecale]